MANKLLKQFLQWAPRMQAQVWNTAWTTKPLHILIWNSLQVLICRACFKNHVVHAGPDLADERPYANPLARHPSPTVTTENWKALNNLRKDENDDNGTLSKYAQYKICKSLLEFLAITAFVAAFDAKAINDVEFVLGWCSSGFFYLHRRTKRKCWGEIVDQIHCLHILYTLPTFIFYKFHIYFFLSVLNSCIQNIQFPKAKHAAHLCGSIN